MRSAVWKAREHVSHLTFQRPCRPIASPQSLSTACRTAISLSMLLHLQPWFHILAFPFPYDSWTCPLSLQAPLRLCFCHLNMRSWDTHVGGKGDVVHLLSSISPPCDGCADGGSGGCPEEGGSARSSDPGERHGGDDRGKGYARGMRCAVVDR